MSKGISDYKADYRLLGTFMIWLGPFAELYNIYIFIYNIYIYIHRCKLISIVV